MYVCVYVRMFVRLFVCVQVVNFLSCDDSKEIAPIALKFCMDVCICFLKNPIDFGDDLPKIVSFRKYRRFCLIWTKYVFI